MIWDLKVEKSRVKYYLRKFSFQRTWTHVHVRYMLSPVRLSSVTFVRPIQAVQIFGNISTALSTLAIHWHPLKVSRRCPKGTPLPGELNTRGVAKYSDFGPIDGYITETMQVSINHRNSYISFRLVPKSVILNDLERRTGRYFSEFV